jgi:DNA-binding HxlR family transcriptional regulator
MNVKDLNGNALDSRLQALVIELIGRIADKWTLIVLEVLTDGKPLRFTELARQVPGISQKMLTQTLRQMERDGMIDRKVFPVIPPHVEYRLTARGQGLGEAFCGVWTWAEENLSAIDASRAAFDRRISP